MTAASLSPSFLDRVRIACAEAVGAKYWASGKYVMLMMDKPANPLFREVAGFEEGKEPRLHIPRYTTSANAALELVAALWKEADLSFVCGNALGIWDATFQRYDREKDHLIQFTAEAETLPLAICLAFLRARNIPVPTP